MKYVVFAIKNGKEKEVTSFLNLREALECLRAFRYDGIAARIEKHVGEEVIPLAA